MRKEFEVPANLPNVVSRVSLFVSSCQYHLLYLDGKRIGDHELDVVWTKFAENRSYSALPTSQFETEAGCELCYVLSSCCSHVRP
eukprot:SAG31_NODE_1508_length_8063_cov_3.156956_6_plen_85_part_00